MTLLEPGSPVLEWLAGIQDAAPQAAMAAVDSALQAPGVERRMRFLMGAYSMVWVILAIYLLTLSVRLRRLVQQLRRLRERVGL